MANGSWKFDNKTIPGVVLVALGILFLVGGLGAFNVVGRLIGALLFAAIAYLVYRDGKSKGNEIQQLAALPIAGLALASLFAGFGGGALFLAAIGLAFAVVWRRNPARWWAVIVAGVLGSCALAAALPGAIAGTAFLLGMAATFFALTRLESHAQSWGIYPAGVFVVLALVDLVGGSGGWLVPAALIVGGVYLLYREGRLGGLGRRHQPEAGTPPEAAPSAPSAPLAPVTPAAPVAPVAPSAPVAPVGPVPPAAPATPTAPDADAATGGAPLPHPDDGTN